jgi:hypothetical protein
MFGDKIVCTRKEKLMRAQFLTTRFALVFFLVFAGIATPASANDEYLDEIENKTRAALGDPIKPKNCIEATPAKNIQCVTARQKQRIVWVSEFIELMNKDFHLVDGKYVSSYLKNSEGKPAMAADAQQAIAIRLAPIEKTATEDWSFAHTQLERINDDEQKDSLYSELLVSFQKHHPELEVRYNAIYATLQKQLAACHPFYDGENVDMNDARLKATKASRFETWESCNTRAGTDASAQGKAVANEFETRGFASEYDKQATARFDYATGSLVYGVQSEQAEARKKSKELNEPKGCDAACVASVKATLAQFETVDKGQADIIVRCAHRIEAKNEDRRDSYNEDVDAYTNGLMRNCRQAFHVNKPTTEEVCKASVVRRMFKNMCRN